MSLYGKKQAEEVLWFQKYRPKKLEECVLPKGLLEIFAGIIKSGEIPNLLFSGKAGVGKTTVARVLAQELGYEVLFINGSNEGKLIDTLRTKMMQFASTVSFTGGRKLIHIDEADALPVGTQEACRAFIEEFSGNCAFILTCNYQNRLIDPFKKRFKQLDFSIPEEEKQTLMLKMFQRCCGILNENNIPFEKKVVAEFVQSKFPDFRTILLELQVASYVGKIDSSILVNKAGDQITEVCMLMKNKDFKSIREWVARLTLEPTDVYREIYDFLYTKRLIKDVSIPDMTLTMAKYNYQHALAIDPQINMMGMFTELMINCEWN